MDKDKKREDYRKYLKKKIISLIEELDYTKGELRRLEDGGDISDISDSDEDELFYLDNISGV